MFRFQLVLGLALWTSAIAGAHEFFSTKITWTREISRIVARRCLSCHQQGGKAFSLATYAEARPWAKAMQEEVLNRRMPPWGAAKGFGNFIADAGLSQEEISLLADWVEGGAPEGDRQYLAPAARAKTAVPTSPKTRKSPMPSGALTSSLTVKGIVPPPSVKAGTQVTAVRPDGSVEPLLWVVEPKSAARREFVFREAVALPRGTRFAVSNTPASGFTLLLGP